MFYSNKYNHIPFNLTRNRNLFPCVCVCKKQDLAWIDAYLFSILYNSAESRPAVAKNGKHVGQDLLVY